MDFFANDNVTVPDLNNIREGKLEQVERRETLFLKIFVIMLLVGGLLIVVITLAVVLPLAITDPPIHTPSTSTASG